MNIRKAVVSFAPNPTVSNLNLAVDDVEFDTVGPPPPCLSTRNPVVILSSPASGQTVRFNRFELVGHVDTQSPLKAAELTVRGTAGIHSFDLLTQGIMPRNGGDFGAHNVQDLLFPGANTLTVKARDCLGPGESSADVTYQPCDASTTPVVTNMVMVDPQTSSHTVMTSDNFQLTGEISSPFRVDSVTVTVTAGLPNPEGFRTDVRTSPDGKKFACVLNRQQIAYFGREPKPENENPNGERTVQVAAKNSEGCVGEKSLFVVLDKRVLQRISGVSYIRFAKEDDNDAYKAENGYLHVSHDPGCAVLGLSHGNDGDDRFFTTSHDLPFWATLQRVDFKQFWPKARRPNGDNLAVAFGGGSYLTSLTRGDRQQPSNKPRVTVHWENACVGDWGGKNIEYVISFIVSVPESLVRAGVTPGEHEPMFDPNQLPLDAIQPPNGFGFDKPGPIPVLPPTKTTKTGRVMLNITKSDTGVLYCMGTILPVQAGVLKKIRNNVNTTFTPGCQFWFAYPGADLKDVGDPQKGHLLDVNQEATPGDLKMPSPAMDFGIPLLAAPNFPTLPLFSDWPKSVQLEYEYESPGPP